MGEAVPAGRQRPVLDGDEAATSARAAGAAAGCLPAPPSSFVGRERERAQVVAALAGTRVLTLTGAGGCGKTRLALQAAEASAWRHPGGTWWVGLAPLGDPAQVTSALAAALGVRPAPGRDDLGAAVALLAGRRALVVLDSCEHVVDEAARVAEALAVRCPRVTVLATSRTPLGVPGEVDWRVPSLALPPAAPGAPLEEVAGADAVRLLLERAAQVRPGFALTAANAAAVVRVCHAVDGIPLALELAAARLRTLSAEQVADGLADRFRLLTGGARTALPRQRTLRASVDWSHDLLGAPQRVVLRRLGVFAAGFDLALAERVAAGDGIDARDVLDLLDALVAQSLVQAEERDGAVRHRLLETVREYALERLLEAGEAERVRDRHRDAHLELAERLACELLTPRQVEVLAALDAHAADLEQAVARAAATAPERALRLCAALVPWWRLRGRFTQAEAAVDRALAAVPRERPRRGAPPEARARAALRTEVAWGRAYLLAFAGRFDDAVGAAHDVLEDAERLGDDRLTARALMVLGKADLMGQPPPACRPRLERARALAVASGDDLCRMHVTHALAFSHLFQEDHPAARACFGEVLPVVERTGHREFRGNHWAATGWMRYVAGDLAGSRTALERGALAARQAGDTVTEAGVTAYLACVHAASGEPLRGLQRLLPVRGRALAQGAGFLLPWAEVAVAHASAAAGRLDDAVVAADAALAGPAGDVRYAAVWAQAERAEALLLRGDAAAAARDAEQTLALAGLLGNPWFAARARLVLGRLAARDGRWAEAERLHHEALAALAGGGFRLGMPSALEALAEVAAGVGDPVGAARALGAAGRVRGELGLVPWRHARTATDALVATVRGALGAEDFARAHCAGAALTLDEAVAWLRRARGTRRRPPGGWESLTPTELAVVRHVAAGLTNPQIGERLFISRGTVKAHLAHVYAKLGLRSRADLVREAARREAAGHALATPAR